jgi:lipid-binding SYLF domain-containing protein
MRFAPAHLYKLAWIGVLLLAGCASPDTRQSAGQQVSAAEATLTNFQKDPEMRWFRDNIKKARAVIISPKITRAGFVLGGSGGDALVLVRDPKTGAWSGPAFYNMGTGSFGLQAGVDFSEVVILVMNEKALDALMSRSMTLGGDASVAAGPVGVGASAPIAADMVSFSRSKGVYAGVSLEGAVVSPDNNANSAYYGQAISPADILIRHSVSNPASASLHQALARSTQ